MTQNVFAGKKVALVHDWLNGMRGGEKCLEVFCELFPDADLYTLFYEKGKLTPTIESMNIITSFVQKLPHSSSKYRYYLPLFPLAIEQFDLSDYDLILSSSHCVAKGVKHREDTYHASYIHAPMRYMWGLFDTYFNNDKASKGGGLPLVYWAARCVRPYLRHWDVKSSKNVHNYFCNSKNIQRQVQWIYGRNSQVIHPPVDISRFQKGVVRHSGLPRGAPPLENQGGAAPWYLMVGAFAPNKRVDLAIEVFNQLKIPLKIVGSGQDEAYCRSIAQSHIEFLGDVDDTTLEQLYKNANAFIFPGEDDFGITPLEAQASGTPVIAYAKGGALETVSENTGIFFSNPTVESLSEAVLKMEKSRDQFSAEQCALQANRFNRERYKLEMLNALEQGYSSWQNTNHKNTEG